MDIQDGFIVGIFNYCNAWCDTCPFTSHCRVFADRARMEAQLDPSFKRLLEAPPLPSDVPPPPPRWMQELIEEMNEIAAQPLSAEDKARAEERRDAVDSHPLQAEATAYAAGVRSWLGSHGDVDIEAADHPVSVIAWYHNLVAAKIHRALHGASHDFASEFEPRDCDGSAKVALLGIERSRVAWQAAAEQGIATRDEAARFSGQLASLGARLEDAFPKARLFVRPGFDEPDEAARLLAAER
jgi:hypothetical protein